MATPERIAELKAIVAVYQAANPPPVGPVQLTGDDLPGMTPSQIVAAQNAGQCDDLLGVRTDWPWVASDRQLTTADLSAMTPAQIVAAQKAGQCADLMTGTTRPAPPS